MSETAVMRTLMRLSSPGALLALCSNGSDYGVFANGDRRRRPTARLDAASVRDLESEGVIERRDGGFVLTAAGSSRLARSRAEPGMEYAAQHGALGVRAAITRRGQMRRATAYVGGTVLARLQTLKDGAGQPWLDAAELAAAAQLRADWERGQIGLVRGSDWSAPPGAAPRSCNAYEAAAGAAFDARRRVAEALEALAAPLRRAVERVCLHEDGLEALERAESWPARSGKLALRRWIRRLRALLLESAASSRTGHSIAAPSTHL